MKRIITIFIVAAAIICLTACEKNSYEIYIIEGRVVDKITKEPVKDIYVCFHRCDIIHPPSTDGQKPKKTSPIGGGDYSLANGEFRTLETSSTSLLYFYDYYGVYKDISISVDFSNVPLSGTPHKNYKGDYVLNVGDIELEKTE